MVARQTTRFIGYIICIPMGLLILFQYRNMVGADFTALFSNIPRLIEILLYFMFILGVGISFNFEVLGGLIVFLSPFILLIIDWINAGRFLMPGPDLVVMLAGSAFLLLTAQRNKD